jgi:hypothetical protein
MNRRQAALTFGALWTTLVVPTGVAAQATSTLTWTPKGLTMAQARTLDAVAEVIMPATDTPGAREAGVPAFVDRAVAIYNTPAEAKAIKDGLDRIETDARAQGGAFASLKPEQQAAILARYEAPPAPPQAPKPAVGRGDTETGLANAPAAKPTASGPPFFPLLKELVTVGYFTSRLGATKAVRYDPNPGAYRGCVPLSQIGRAWAL